MAVVTTGEQPVKPENVEPVSGVAVSVTTVPLENDAPQLVPQFMPVGLLITVPLPIPDFATVSV